jgi:hypothetical protein
VAIAGDVLAVEAVGVALAGLDIGCDLAWNPVLCPGGLSPPPGLVMLAL